MNLKSFVTCLMVFGIHPTFLAAAVSLSHDQTGQALVIPYYSVANNLNTLVTIKNTQDQPKAIKIHVKDGFQGANIQTFNLYLGGNDSWSFAMSESNNGPRILDTDDSCTLGLVNGGFTGPPPGVNGWNGLVGTIEFIEMGQVLTESNDFFGDLTASENCIRLADAWYAQGPNSFWQAESTAEMAPASGGISAEVSVIDVTQGFAFSVPTLAFSDFFAPNTIYHRVPEEAEPNLASGSQDSLVLHDGQAFQTSWPSGYEAISALMMKTTVENNYDVTSSLGAQAEWVVSFPTLPWHRDNIDSQKPFMFEMNDGFRFPSKNGTAFTYYDREGLDFVGAYACVLPPPGTPCPPESTLNHMVNTYLVDPYLTTLSDSNISGPPSDAVVNLNSGHATLVPDSFVNGQIKLHIISDFVDDSSEPIYALINDRGRDTATHAVHHYHGIPVTGFAVQIYRNANAQQGLLATYASAKPHAGERRIEVENN